MCALVLPHTLGVGKDLGPGEVEHGETYHSRHETVEEDHHLTETDFSVTWTLPVPM